MKRAIENGQIQPPPKAQRAVLALNKGQFRHLTAAEKAARGLSPGADWIVPKGKSLTLRTAAVTFSKWKDKQAGLNHTKAATLRLQKLFGYSSPEREHRAIGVREGISAKKQFGGRLSDKDRKLVARIAARKRTHTRNAAGQLTTDSEYKRLGKLLETGGRDEILDYLGSSDVILKEAA